MGVRTSILGFSGATGRAVRSGGLPSCGRDDGGRTLCCCASFRAAARGEACPVWLKCQLKQHSFFACVYRFSTTTNAFSETFHIQILIELRSSSIATRQGSIKIGFALAALSVPVIFSPVIFSLPFDIFL